MEELDDFDVFDYWDDLQYGDDSYWEYAGPRPPPTTLKRKRVTNGTTIKNDKRLRLIDTAGDNVRFVNRVMRNEMMHRRPAVVEKRESFALFPDWRQRFANVDGAPMKKEMPASMKQAAEGTYDESPPKTLPSNMAFVDANGVEVEDEEDEDENDMDDMQAQLASLDPETLKTILRQKLGNAGLDGMDEQTLMKMLGKMISGDDEADEEVDKLANNMVERATGGGDAALSDWLSQQGVSLDAAGDDEDDTDSVATPELPHAVNGLKEGEKLKSSPSDSAIEMQKAVVGPSTELAIHPSSPSEAVRKRTAPFADAEALETRKRKRVSFEVAAATETIDVTQQGEGEDTHDPSNEEVISSHDAVPAVSEDTTDGDNILVAQTKATNATGVMSNHTNGVAQSTETGATQPGHAPDREDQVNTAEEQDEEEIVVAASAPAKNTRKRKAEAEKPAPKKKQATAKKASGSAEAVGKRTRSTRAAAKVGK